MKESTWVKIFLGIYLPIILFLNIFSKIDTQTKIVLSFISLVIIMLFLSTVDEWDITNK